MKKIILPLIIVLFSINISAQKIELPKELRTYPKVTTYEELGKKVDALDDISDLLNVEIIGHSVEGRNIYALKFSKSTFGEDHSKIKVLIFAQQHGNEQSGKEGALLLAENLLRSENAYLFDNIDLAVIPQINPDGAEQNKRRNAHDIDLNRNHLILTEPETIALHRFFDRYLFEVNMDIHEYFPYSESWMTKGYRKNSAVTVGGNTNINISKEIRDLSNKEALPFLQDQISKAGYSSFAYCPGGPPSDNYLRYSTFDINDGRQSFGIQNSLSFIQEGMNGKDKFIENLQERAYGQMTGMCALVDYVFHNKDKISKLIASQRDKLISEPKGELVSIQMEHIKNGEKIHLPVFSLKSNTDSLIISDNFHAVVTSLYDVKKPEGYLIPVTNKKLLDWADRHTLKIEPYIPNDQQLIEQYYISRIDSIDFEGDIIVNPEVEVSTLKTRLKSGEFMFIPLDQLKSKLIVQDLEPKSMIGLATYSPYQDLLEIGKIFPVTRLLKR